MKSELTVTRDVTRTECPWLEKDISAGSKVYAFHGPTYGCVSDSGRAVSKLPNETPFFEVPRDALSFSGN